MREVLGHETMAMTGRCVEKATEPLPGNLDVPKHDTPVESYYRLVKTVESDPEFDTKRAKKKLRRYVESRDHAIRLKAQIMVDHFHEQVRGTQQDRRVGAGYRLIRRGMLPATQLTPWAL